MARTPRHKRKAHAHSISLQIERLMTAHDWTFGEVLNAAQYMLGESTFDPADISNKEWIKGLRSVK